jgi:hypothetical protein
VNKTGGIENRAGTGETGNKDRRDRKQSRDRSDREQSRDRRDKTCQCLFEQTLKFDFDISDEY